MSGSGGQLVGLGTSQAARVPSYQCSDLHAFHMSTLHKDECLFKRMWNSFYQEAGCTILFLIFLVENHTTDVLFIGNHSFSRYVFILVP